MTRCPHCKRKLHKALMTTHDGQRMCAKCKAQKIKDNEQ